MVFQHPGCVVDDHQTFVTVTADGAALSIWAQFCDRMGFTAGASADFGALDSLVVSLTNDGQLFDVQSVPAANVSLHNLTTFVVDAVEGLHYHISCTQFTALDVIN